MCLRGTAETMFKRADWKNGVEGWRRLVRQIENGKAISLGSLRRQDQELHIHQIKSLDDVAEGVASFERHGRLCTRRGSRSSRCAIEG